MIIGIDSSRYQNKEATGVEWYSFHIINGLINQLKNQKIRLYSPSKLNLENNIVVEGKRLWTISALSKELKRRPVDVLFIPSHTFPLSLGKKNVITIHDVAFMRFKKAYGFIQRQYLIWSTKRAVKVADKIIVPSFATKSDLISFFNCPESKIEVTHHGYSGKISSNDNKEKWILFIGRVEKKKNVGALIQGFREFLVKNPDWKLKIAGKPGFGYEEIKSLAGDEERVEFLGYISEKEKSELLFKSAIFAFPSLYEGFGLPILEAFANENAVCCSDAGSLKEVAGDSAIYFKSSN